MDLDSFLKKDIEDFIMKEHERDINIKGVRDDEMSLFDMTRDYAKELRDHLSTHNMAAAMEVFNDVRASYNRMSFTDPSRKKVYAILKELFSILRNYVQDKGIKNSYSMELDYLAKQSYFNAAQLPKKILSELEKQQKSPAVEESQNLVKPVQKDGYTMRDVAEKIAKEIPMEDSKELSKVFGKGNVIVEQPIIERVESVPASRYQAQQRGLPVEQPTTVVTQPVASQSIDPAMLKGLVESITDEVVKKTHSDVDPESVKRQVEAEAQHDLLLEKRKQELYDKDLAEKEKRIQDKIAELKKQRELLKKEHQKMLDEERLKLSEEKQRISKEREELKSQIHELDQPYNEKSVGNIVDGLKGVNNALLDGDVLAAKRRYRHVKNLFSLLPKVPEKSQLYKSILGAYDHIKFMEKNPPKKEGVPGAVERHLHDARKHVLKGDYGDAKGSLRAARKACSGIGDKDVRADVQKRIEQHGQSIAVHEAKANERENDAFEDSDLYRKGVYLLYNDRRDEAARVFEKVLELNPNNNAARIRLKEART